MAATLKLPVGVEDFKEIRQQGFYYIDKTRLIEQVLHGGSNNPDDEIRRACQIGIRKVNISSDFKYAFFKKVDEVIQETGGFVPAKVLTPGINDAKQVIREKMELFGSLGKAELYR